MSRLCEGLDEQVDAWAKRPLDGQPYPFVLFDALQIKVRRQGAVRATTVMLGVGIGARCAEQHEEWSTGRRYLTMDAFFAWEHAQAENAQADPDPTAAPLPHAA